MQRAALHVRVTQAHELGQILTLPPSSTVVLDVAAMTSMESTGWEGEINRSLRTCGCDEATLALLLNFGVLSFVGWSQWEAISGAPVLATVIGIGCSCLAVAVGKTVGRLRGRRRLVASVDRLRAVLVRRAAT